MPPLEIVKKTFCLWGKRYGFICRTFSRKNSHRKTNNHLLFLKMLEPRCRCFLNFLRRPYLSILPVTGVLHNNTKPLIKRHARFPSQCLFYFTDICEGFVGFAGPFR